MPDEVGILKTYLIGMSICDIEKLPKDFLEYDTEYAEGYYPLPKKGKYMVLTLFTNGILWTTIRRWTPQKESYYRGFIGHDVDIVIKEE